MTSKQDRQGARTPADLDRRYGQRFAEILGVANDSRNIANEAKKGTQDLDQSLGQDGIFNRLTNYGQWKGLYRDEEGNIYINADYIKTGLIKAQLVNAVNNNEDYVIIEDGKILSGNRSKQYFSLQPIPGGDGAWAITFNNEVMDGGYSLRVYGSLSWDSISLGAVEANPAPFQVKAEGYADVQTVRLRLPNGPEHTNELRDLYAYWQSNGDGTYSIVGYEEKLQ